MRREGLRGVNWWETSAGRCWEVTGAQVRGRGVGNLILNSPILQKGPYNPQPMAMNYATYASHLTQPLPTPFRLLPSPPTLQKPNLIAALSQALALSLNNYQASLHQSQPTTPPPACQRPLPSASKSSQPLCIEILSDDEEPTRKVQNLKGQNELPETATSPSEPRSSLPLPAPTLALLPIDPKHKSKKDKPQCPFQVQIPQLDLIDTTTLPALSLPVSLLQRKRADLLGRRVEEWVERAKGRKEKREIRNLGN